MFLLSTPLWLGLNLDFEADNLNILSGYIGIILVAGSFCALGCLISSFCSSPAVSYLLSLGILLFFCMADFTSAFQKLHFSPIVENKLSSMLNLEYHYQDIITGQIGTDNIVFFVLIIILSLGLNTLSIEYKRN